MLFVSTKRNLRLIKKPTDVIIDNNRRSQVIRGEKVEFIDGRFRTDDQEIIDWLIGNKEKGIHPHPEFVGGRFTAVDEKHLAKMREQAVQIVEGANSSSNNPMLAQQDGATSQPTPQQVNIAAVAELLAESEKRTDDKINTALGQIMELLKVGVSAPTKTDEPEKPVEPKQKKVFRCPICREPFSTGIAVGRHKKEAHPVQGE